MRSRLGLASLPCSPGIATRPCETMIRPLDHSRGTPPPYELLRGASLFLDFDGTLVDIAPSPDAVRVGSKLIGLLSRLRERLGGRVAILTGRSAADVDALLSPMELPVAAHHGLETRSGGQAASTMKRPDILDSVVSELRQLERQYPGVLVEDKPLSVALHYRLAPGAEEACRSAVLRAAERSGLEMQPGKMVFELKPRGANKGDALRALMAALPFAGTLPVFLGDDLTDEPAFGAAQEMGGAGVVIGDRAPTAANFRIASVEETLEWLAQACELA